MQRLIFATSLTVLPVAALSAAEPGLPGVSSEETTIPTRIQEVQKGHGDVLFMRDSSNNWYRVETNQNCLKGIHDANLVSVLSGDISGRIDKMSKVVMRDGSARTCLVDSIRSSDAPPMVDSKSVVTLD